MRKTLLFVVALLSGFGSNAAVFTVTSTGDNGGINPSAFAGTGTLRQAIINANATAGFDQIIFNIPTGGVQTITLSGVLPAITETVRINGYSQPGASAGPIASRQIMIELITPGTQAYGLLVEASGTEISGIAFTSLSNSSGDGAVSVYRNTGPATPTHDVWIWGNYFNSNAAGTVTTGTGYGLAIYGNTSGAGAVSNLQNWIIGTNGDQVNDAWEGNLFSHADPAIEPLAADNEPLRFFNCDNFVVAGNIIGLQKDGVTPLQTFNSTAAQNAALIATNYTGFRVGTNGDGVSDALERNVIAGMRGAAITFFANINGGTYGNDGNTAYTNRGTGNNLVAGNYIGTDITGLATGTDLQNRTSVRLEGTSFNQIGSETNAAMRNVLVNNKLTPGNGVSLLGGRWAGGNNAPAEGNRIEGNYIGVLADGTTASGNVQGIRLNGNNQQAAGEVGVIKTRIAGNVIANSTSAGINIGAFSNMGVLVYDNTISRNSIYANGRLGINLASTVNEQVVSPNDGVLLVPNTTSVNRMMDYGIVSKALLSGDNLAVSGYIGNSASGTTAFGANAVVEFFIADNVPANQNGEVIAGDGQSKAHGEGRTFLGTLTANANGTFSGVLNVAGMGVTANVTEITNTATEFTSTGSTSEFGANVMVAPAVPPVAEDDIFTSPTVVPVTFSILTNDDLGDGTDASLDPSLVDVDLDPSTPAIDHGYNVAGEGMWTYDPITGSVTFQPDAGLSANPTPIPYLLIELFTSLSDPAQITVTYGSMPVTLAGFSVKKEGAVAQLNWVTTEEINSDYFEIQHSTDGGIWNSLTRVSSHENSRAIVTYRYEHATPGEGTNYYRLKMVDLDGTYAFSRIVNVHFEMMPAIAFPNPVVTELYFKTPGSSGLLQVRVFDAKGDVRLNLKTVDRKVNLGMLPAGKYVVRVTDSTGAVKTFLVVR